MPITITITHPDAGRTVVTGFHQLWAFYVRGFRPDHHCQGCLVGTRSALLSRDGTPLGTKLVFDESADFNQLYVCGVASGPQTMRGERNFHLALEPAPRKSFQVRSYNGYVWRIRNGRLLSIPEPDAGLAHLGRSHYRCGNFRFGIKYYGYPGRETAPGE